MISPDLGFLNLVEIEERARPRLPPSAFDYVAGGSGGEVALRGNREAFTRWRLRTRALVDVSARDCGTTVLGRRVAFPALVAPTAFHRLLHPEGETATTRGAARAGTVMIASTLATTSLEDVAAASDGPKWFQLYVYKDRDLTRRLVDRAVAAGYEAIVLTVDAAVWGRRERDARHGFTLPPSLSLANFEDMDKSRLPSLGAGADGLAAYVASQLDPSLTWDVVDWLRETSGLPVVVKGIVTADDARLAIDHGASAVVVSNHGGRQLDACVATLDALPEVVEAVRDRCEVYVDGGVRRGTDVAVALALGARAVLVGRPVLWGLALAGEEGVTRALRLLADEFDAAMALCGACRPAEIARDHVVEASRDTLSRIGGGTASHPEIAGKTKPTPGG